MELSCWALPTMTTALADKRDSMREELQVMDKSRFTEYELFMKTNLLRRVEIILQARRQRAAY